MTCNCNIDSNTVLCTQGTSLVLTVKFDNDISTYKTAEFVVRKNFNSTPVISKIIDIEGLQELTIELTPEDTKALNDFNNGASQASYIWGLDLVDDEIGTRVSVFPKTGETAPLFIVYRHVVETL